MLAELLLAQGLEARPKSQVVWEARENTVSGFIERDEILTNYRPVMECLFQTFLSLCIELMTH